MKWKEYEKKVHSYFQGKFPFEKISSNVKLDGKLSKTKREIDILIESQISDIQISIAIECKNWSTKLDVADIGSFIDKLKDVGISKGMMITNTGYTESAKNRVLIENDIQLYVLDFESLNDFKGFWANPYAGDCGAFISAPSGWIIDAEFSEEEMRNLGWQCILYPMGMDVQEACYKKEFGYFRIVDQGLEIDDIFLEQNEKVKEKDSNSKIKLWEEIINNATYSFREIYYKHDDYMEYSAGCNTDRFHAFCVLTCKKDFYKITLTRLRYIMSNIYFIVIEGIDKKNSHKYWHALKKLKNKK